MSIRSLSASLLLTVILAACSAETMPRLDLGESAEPQGRALPRIRTVSCEGPARRNCKFINSPVKLDGKPRRFPESPYPFYRTRDDLKFVDADKDLWVAPTGTWTDGASIPPLFVPILGDPRSREFMNAATVHDAYCAERNAGGPYYHAATWQEVHRVFYDGLLASGTPVIKARIMYAAVYLAGPRWKGVRRAGNEAVRKAAAADGLRITPASAVIEGGALRTLQADEPLTRRVSRDRLIETFKEVKVFIEREHPTIDELEVHLTRLELELTGASAPQLRRKRSNFKPGAIPTHPEPGENDGGSRGASGTNDNSRGGGTSGNSGGGGANDASLQ